jgi:hypothetical protein
VRISFRPRCAISSQRLGPLWKRLLNAAPAKFIPTIVATPTIQRRTAKIFRHVERTFNNAYELPWSAFFRVLIAISRQASGESEADQTMIPTRTKRMKRNCETRKIILSPPVFFRLFKV